MDHPEDFAYAAESADANDGYEGIDPMQSLHYSAVEVEDSQAWWHPRDFASNKHIVFVVTIFVIGLLQFQGRFSTLAWYALKSLQFWSNSLRLHCLTGPVLRWFRGRVELLRAARLDSHVSGIRLALDVIVSLLGWAMHFTRHLCQSTLESTWNIFQCGPMDVARHRKRRRNNTAKRNRCNSLPELEDSVLEPSFGSEHYHGSDSLDENGCVLHEMNLLQMSPAATPSRGHWDWGVRRRELEPAFLDDGDYPANWMVYHPVLRVVTKVQAEQYDREQIERQQLNEAAIHCDIHAEEKKDDVGGEPKHSSANVYLGDGHQTKHAQTRQLQNENHSASSGIMPMLRSAVAT